MLKIKIVNEDECKLKIDLLNKWRPRKQKKRNICIFTFHSVSFVEGDIEDFDFGSQPYPHVFVTLFHHLTKRKTIQSYINEAIIFILEFVVH